MVHYVLVEKQIYIKKETFPSSHRDYIMTLSLRMSINERC